MHLGNLPFFDFRQRKYMSLCRWRKFRCHMNCTKITKLPVLYITALYNTIDDFYKWWTGYWLWVYNTRHIHSHCNLLEYSRHYIMRVFICVKSIFLKYSQISIFFPWKEKTKKKRKEKLKIPPINFTASLYLKVTARAKRFCQCHTFKIDTDTDCPISVIKLSMVWFWNFKVKQFCLFRIGYQCQEIESPCMSSLNTN